MFWPASIRARWMLTFAVLAVTTCVLAAVGMLALVNTRSAVQGFDEEILPSVANSLALAERVAHVAAVAPHIAEVAIISKLTQESAELQLRQQEVERLAKELPLAQQSASGLPRLLTSLHATLGELIEDKRQSLFLREDTRAKLFALGQLQRGIPTTDDRRAAALRRDLDLLVLTLQVALSASSAEELEEVRGDYARRYHEFAQVGHAEDAGGASALDTLPELSQGIFQLRQKQLKSDERKAYLLASTRLLSDELTNAVNRHVAAVSADVSSRRNQVTVAVGSGLTAVAVAFLVAGLALLVGFWTLREALKGLAKVTSAMTSLAEGGSDFKPVRRGRNAEIDTLADAFEVFRENTLAMRAMAQDIVEKQTLLQTVFDNIDDGLSVFDAEGKLVAWNPRFAELMAQPPGALYVGLMIGDLQRGIPALEEAAAEAGLSKEMNTSRQRQPLSVDVPLLDGRVLSVRSRPMPQGGFVTLYNDLSERRALELQVRQTQKMDVLGQLTGGVAHDFNNLLAAVVSNLQLLLSLPDISDNTKRIAQRALKASERGGVLTTRLLAFARRQPLRYERVEIDRLLSGMEDLIGYSLGPGIHIEMALQAGGLHVFIDGGQLENAVLNLTLNASAAMPKGGLLRIQTRLSPQREFVELTVSDTGHGMPRHVLERIFEPFFSTRKSDGSGLGLSIVYGFVKQSGGDIRASSIVNRGTSFVITLPVIDALTPGPESPPSLMPPRPLHGLRVLLVEDDVDVRESTQELLEQQGAQVVSAGSSVAALRALKNGIFDLLLSDVGLGTDDDGLRLMRIAQRLRPALRGLLMSGLPSDLLARRYGVAPAQPILRKPFLADELSEAASAALKTS
ncbi:PAS-domain containing protein [Variovorax sp. ZS18.2.2]|uniref:PAS-domain containing protein n=1 Tax=Variovorax sp. ZS18.2.2 TaxID=2971255 RepID=UPI002150959B|nr:PAS-domain containing protein [Variovorax sp. ZS18.2.2]MCR6476920.1 PAS-domain containing protein [Variovorax sp. ZS18.2.2]